MQTADNHVETKPQAAPTGEPWSDRRWARELRRIADACESSNPFKSARLRAAADRIDPAGVDKTETTTGPQFVSLRIVTHEARVRLRGAIVRLDLSPAYEVIGPALPAIGGEALFLTLFEGMR